MRLFIYKEIEVDVSLELDENKKLVRAYDTENQCEVNELVTAILDDLEWMSCDLYDIYEYLDNVTRGQISLQSFLFAVDDYIEYLK